MADFPLTVYLAGEIHSSWREDLRAACKDLPIGFLSPVCDHAASDDAGEQALGEQATTFWRDHIGAKVNAMRTRTAIARADVVVVRFGPKYKQWNAAFDAGIAHALGKHLIILHDAEHDHALKEIDGAAQTTARDPQQVAALLRYVCTQD